MFEKQHEHDTYMDRLGAAKRNQPGGLLIVILVAVALIGAFFYFNFTAMGIATGATGGIVKHGLAYTFLQPFYSFWSVYYVLIGSGKRV
ncbi:unnamed protein product [Ectocarpus sp. 12 AP-2014]